MMLGNLECQEQIMNKCQYFWTKKKKDMQMRCKMMQITDIQFQSKATFGNKSAAGLAMEERVYQQGQHILCPNP